MAQIATRMFDSIDRAAMYECVIKKLTMRFGINRLKLQVMSTMLLSFLARANKNTMLLKMKVDPKAISHASIPPSAPIFYKD